jgi:hypothetical protein
MNWRRLLRLQRRAAEDVAERGEISESLPTSTDLPFGVKALNEGSSIEGVWDARTTTPLHGPTSRNRSPLITPAKMLPRSKRDNSTSSIPTLDITDSPTPAKSTGSWAALLGKGAQATASTLPPDAPKKQTDRASVTLPTRKKSNSITISYSGPSSKPNHAVYRGPAETDGLLSTLHSCSSYITDLCLGGPESPVEAVLDTESPPTKLRLRRSFTLSNTRRRKFVIGGRSSPIKVAEKSQQPQKIEVDVIDRMNAHRRLHSAEQGQLIPRLRPQSEDNARVDTDYCSCDEETTPSRATSWPEQDNIRLGKTTQQKARKVEAASVEPEKAVVELRPLPKPCPSAWTDRTQELFEDSMNRNVSAGESLVTPSLCSDTTLSTEHPTKNRLSIENKTTRKVNEGFEVLPAGSLQKQAGLKVISIWPDISSEAQDKKKKPKKLQKRHRRSSSASSRGSQSSTEGVRSGHLALLGAAH